MLLFAIKSLFAMQMVDPVKWKYDYKQIDASTVELIFTAIIDDGYHVYGTNFADGGPIRTTFSLEESDAFKTLGKVKELTKPKEKKDPSFDNMLISLHSKKGIFSQKIKINSNKPFEVKGFVEYMACTDESCLPPVQKEFSINIKAQKFDVSQSTIQQTDIAPQNDTSGQQNQTSETENIITSQVDTVIPANERQSLITNEQSNSSIWGFFILAFLAGLAGTLTPCVFPMIPMTVSFFMRGSENHRKAIFRGILFGLTIMATYTLAGVLVSLTSLGAEFANQLSTHWLPNSIFFILFLIFAASFFGLFEIVLPSSLVNKTDQQADKGGIFGIVFMALATVLVSFSCTGPIVGALLVEAAGGLALKPILGMFGFGLAFALPFTFFAIFPSRMKSLPKSGGWLNSVKVVLAFVMLAFSLKFMVNIDQTYHLDLISRELFLAIWIVISVMLGLYILGFIKFSHDSDLPYISVPRLAIAMVAFVFAIYLATGLGSNPLNSVSDMLPPATEKHVVGNTPGQIPANICETPRFGDFLHFPHGLKGYFDYQQAETCAKKLNKPILIDFKGHACSNCKKMDAVVWSKEKIKKSLSEDFVLLGLYTDDRTELPQNEWITSAVDGKVKKTMGQINADFQISKFRSNALPYYVIIDPEGNVLNKPIGTELDAEKYLSFLNHGLKAFEQKSAN